MYDHNLQTQPSDANLRYECSPQIQSSDTTPWYNLQIQPLGTTVWYWYSPLTQPHDVTLCYSDLMQSFDANLRYRHQRQEASVTVHASRACGSRVLPQRRPHNLHDANRFLLTRLWNQSVSHYTSSWSWNMFLFLLWTQTNTTKPLLMQTTNKLCVSFSRTKLPELDVVFQSRFIYTCFGSDIN
jgi:hypothetical protein